ncbi:hypothetical protein [Ktedonobacter racemifer]|uniref:hypothetical protein n=1 Tax=Ktedonobacter racemifer TaxID=363277 RepID=UPI0012FB5499|nr:hypothetical protein [Ktedonobacter racemifer]
MTDTAGWCAQIAPSRHDSRQMGTTEADHISIEEVGTTTPCTSPVSASVPRC